MLSETSQWKDAWKVSGSSQPTVLEIHLGLSFTRRQDEPAKRDEWTECVEELLECVRPLVLHIHHDQHFYQPPEELLSVVNENQYVIDVRDSTWTIWSR